MTLRKLEDLSSTSLRDHGTRERLDRVWQRLEGELETTTPRSRAALWWAPAAAAIIFGSGVVVGSKWARPEAPPTVSAERPPQADPVTPSLAPAAAREQPRPERTATPHHRSRSARAPFIAAEIPPLVEEAPVPVPVVEAPLPPPGPPEWKQLADSGDFEAARKALDASGGFDSVLGSASPAQLMSLVDLARATGERERAVSALRRIVVDSPASPEAPLAAWTLGNLLEQAGDEAGAAEAFALYRRLSPGGDFAEDAVAREVEAALARGNWELAAGLVYKYEKDFPNGRRRDEFRRELEQLAPRDAADEEAEEGPPAPGSPASRPPAP